MTLPTDRDARKAMPIYRGVLKYFPDALAEVAAVSLIGNAQHHADKPIHWDKSKSSDEGDALIRHLLEAGTRDTDGARHSAKVAWRALALLQREIDAEQALPIMTEAQKNEAFNALAENIALAPCKPFLFSSLGAVPTQPSSASDSSIPSPDPHT